MNEDIAKKISEAAQRELEKLLKQFEDDFANTIKRISNLDIEVEPFSTTSNGTDKAGEDFRSDLASLINQQFRRQKTPLEREVNQIGGSLFNTIFSNFFGEGTRTADFNPSVNSSMRLSQSQSAADIFSILSSSGRNN